MAHLRYKINPDDSQAKKNIQNLLDTPFNTTIKKEVVPTQYLKQFKAAVSLLNSSEHFENSLRTYTASVRMTPKLVKTTGLSTPKYIDPVVYIEEKATLATEAMKEVNSIIEQVHFKKKGKDAIIDMQYNLIDTVDKLYYLSLEHQAQVAELINKLSNNK